MAVSRLVLAVYGAPMITILNDVQLTLLAAHVAVQVLLIPTIPS